MTRLACTLSALLLPATLLAEASWPQFRGPDGDGHTAANLPTDLSPDSVETLWRTETPGRGWSSPVIGGGRIYLTSAIETPTTEEERQAMLAEVPPKKWKQKATAKKIELRLLAYDLETGALVNETELFSIEQPQAIHTLNSYASPTPVLDGDTLYCHFGTFGTVALDAETLETRWERKFEIQHGVGPGSSPFVAGNLLVLICDGTDDQFVVAVDKKSGETIWRAERPEMSNPSGDRHKAYNTPIRISSGGRDQLVCMGSQWLCSYDPKDGKELWRLEHGDGFSVVPRPVSDGERVFVSTGFGQTELLAVRTDGEGDVTATHLDWKMDKRVPTKPSPLLVGKDRIFILSDGGIASWIDTATGEPIWVERTTGAYSASPLLSDGRIYVMSQEGDITVLSAADEWEVLFEGKIEGGDGFMASPAVAAGTLVLRSKSALLRVGTKR